MWRLRAWCNGHQALGSPGMAPWALGPKRLQWLNNLSGKPQTPCDLGLCKRQTRSQNRPPKRGRGYRVTAGLTDRHICECLRPRNPSPSLPTLRKRHYRFHPGRSYAQRSLTSESTPPPPIIPTFCPPKQSPSLAQVERRNDDGAKWERGKYRLGAHFL